MVHILFKLNSSVPEYVRECPTSVPHGSQSRELGAIPHGSSEPWVLWADTCMNKVTGNPIMYFIFLSLAPGIHFHKSCPGSRQYKLPRPWNSFPIRMSFPGAKLEFCVRSCFKNNLTPFSLIISWVSPWFKVLQSHYLDLINTKHSSTMLTGRDHSSDADCVLTTSGSHHQFGKDCSAKPET